MYLLGIVLFYVFGEKDGRNIFSLKKLKFPAVKLFDNP